MDWSGCAIDNVVTFNCVPTLFLLTTNGFLLFAGVVSLFVITWASFRLVISGGDAKKVGSARSMITWGIVGLIVVLSSFAIVYLIGYLTGTTDCITDIDKITTGCTN